MSKVDASARDQLMITQPPCETLASKLIDRSRSCLAELSVEGGEPLQGDRQSMGRSCTLKTLGDRFNLPKRVPNLPSCCVICAFVKLDLDGAIVEIRITADNGPCPDIELGCFTRMAKLSQNICMYQGPLELQCSAVIGPWHNRFEYSPRPATLTDMRRDSCGVKLEAHSIHARHDL